MIKEVIKHKFHNLNEIINESRTNIHKANNTKKCETYLSKLHFLKHHKIEKYPVTLNFKWFVSNKRSDLDNKIGKSIIDGMVQAGVIIDDNLKYITKITHEYVESDTDFVEVTIYEIDDNNTVL